METGIHIGTKVSKKTLKPLTNAMLRIMEAKADQNTIRTALEILSKAADCKIENCSISNAHIIGDQHDHVHSGDNEQHGAVYPWSASLED